MIYPFPFPGAFSSGGVTQRLPGRSSQWFNARELLLLFGPPVPTAAAMNRPLSAFAKDPRIITNKIKSYQGIKLKLPIFYCLLSRQSAILVDGARVAKRAGLRPTAPWRARKRLSFWLDLKVLFCIVTAGYR